MPIKINGFARSGVNEVLKVSLCLFQSGLETVELESRLFFFSSTVETERETVFAKLGHGRILDISE